MAKRKKNIKSKKPAAAPSGSRSAFWPLSGAILMFVLAVFLLLGGLGSGGRLPVNMFGAVYWLLGWAAWITPVALVYLGMYKFVSEDHQIPLARLLSMTAVLVFGSGMLFTAFASRAAADLPYSGGHGGKVGELLGSVIMNALDAFPASLILLVATMLSVFFAFNISPSVLMSLGKLFRRRPREDDTGIGELKARAGGDFKLTEGVPVEYPSHKESRETPIKQLASFRNTAAPKLSAVENHEALITASDPDWQFPPMNLLNQKQDKANAGDIESNASIIRETFGEFNIEVKMEGANIGPRVTQYTLQSPNGVKLSKLAAFDKNLEYALAVPAVRIEAPIPGKRAVGIEVPNLKPATVRLSSILQSSELAALKSPLSFAIGKDIAGKPVVADLAKMPHLLVAGQTNSGKSVMVNGIITSLIYRNSPSELKLILVDPKHVELGTYNAIPHLLTPVITEPEKVISALKWAVAEMERRLRTMAEINTSNIAEYNAVKKEAGMPYIVIVIDELADLMMMAARDVEALIVRVAQKARAAGIHLILATQRPSVNVVTGLIKANVPGRIAFTTQSQVDSRTILDQAGAEKLLGQGDMLLLTADMSKPRRVQGALIEKAEVVKVTDFVREQRPADYNDEVVSQPVQLNGKGSLVVGMDGGGEGGDDDMWRDAVHVVLEARKASTSLLQRRLRIGYGRAARLIETMEEQGIVGPADGSRPREVLVSSMDDVFGDGGSTDSDTDSATAQGENY